MTIYLLLAVGVALALAVAERCAALRLGRMRGAPLVSRVETTLRLPMEMAG